MVATTTTVTASKQQQHQQQQKVSAKYGGLHSLGSLLLGPKASKQLQITSKMAQLPPKLCLRPISQPLVFAMSRLAACAVVGFGGGVAVIGDGGVVVTVLGDVVFCDW